MNEAAFAVVVAESDVPCGGRSRCIRNSLSVTYRGHELRLRHLLPQQIAFLVVQTVDITDLSGDFIEIDVKHLRLAGSGLVHHTVDAGFGEFHIRAV
jgi:hypothetical protein